MGLDLSNFQISALEMKTYFIREEHIFIVTYKIRENMEIIVLL